MIALRATLAMQAIIAAMSLALLVTQRQAPASVVVNVNGQSITVAAPTDGTRGWTKEGSGVVSDFAPSGRTGGVSRAQDTPEIMFSVSNE